MQTSHTVLVRRNHEHAYIRSVSAGTHMQPLCVCVCVCVVCCVLCVVCCVCCVLCVVCVVCVRESE